MNEQRVKALKILLQKGCHPNVRIEAERHVDELEAQLARYREAAANEDPSEWKHIRNEARLAALAESATAGSSRPS